MKWYQEGDYIEAWLNEDQCYCTNRRGEGVFFIDYTRNSRRQLTGTCQFSVRGVKNKIAKLRKFLKDYI